MLKGRKLRDTKYTCTMLQAYIPTDRLIQIYPCKPTHANLLWGVYWFQNISYAVSNCHSSIWYRVCYFILGTKHSLANQNLYLWENHLHFMVMRQTILNLKKIPWPTNQLTEWLQYTISNWLQIEFFVSNHYGTWPYFLYLSYQSLLLVLLWTAMGCFTYKPARP